MTCVGYENSLRLFGGDSWRGGRRAKRSTLTIIRCSDDADPAATTLELADVILDRAKVAFVPGEAFGLARYARFSFALGDDDLREGITRLGAFVNG